MGTAGVARQRQTMETKGKTMTPSPILYLHEYEHVPEDVLLYKDDEHLAPWCAESSSLPERAGSAIPLAPVLPPLLCIGIGTYKTRADGELYLCVLIDPDTRQVFSWSMGVYRSAELAGRALERLFAMYDQRVSDTGCPLVIRSSRNAVYGRLYRDVLARFPVRGEMTEKGTRGGVMAVSTFFSRLMIRKGGYQFSDWQDAVNWLSRYLTAEYPDLLR